MPKFKPGDRVRRVKFDNPTINLGRKWDGDYYNSIGDIVEVIKIRDFRFANMVVAHVFTSFIPLTKTNSNYMFWEDNFELAEPDDWSKEPPANLSETIINTIGPPNAAKRRTLGFS